MSEARIVSEWLAAGLAAEAAEDEAIAARLRAVPDPDPFDDDFGTNDPHERVMYGLITGERAATAAEELELDLVELEEFKRQAIERRAAELPTVTAAYAVIEAGLTEVTRRAYLGLGEAMPGERSDLLNVLVGIYRLRLDALPYHPTTTRKA
ncbi:hypothetical protein [Microbacterium sp. As-52]|uniref:hypothetical protein n=1 Tax=Microbacterium sp. As-52 TaxID=3390503 RepID=UPI003CE95416